MFLLTSLGAALILNLPFILNAFYKLITPFIDPITRAKMKFNPSPIADGLFTPEQLFKPGGWGGSVEFEYEHEKYFKPLVELCQQREEAQMKAWREMGGGVGLSEWDFKTKAEGKTPEAEHTDVEKVSEAVEVETPEVVGVAA